ncbi:MAG: hypothetical protein AAF533_15095 [Acidobacteriota bacterium]
MSRYLALSLLLACSLLSSLAVPSAQAQPCPDGVIGPDVIVGDLIDTRRYGVVGTITAFAVGTDACNIGDCPLSWVSSTPEHPVIGQSLYRLKNGRFEMIGQSWLKHASIALQLGLCADCEPDFTGALGVNCSDPYGAGLNGNQGRLGPKFEVNATTGEYLYPFFASGMTGDEIYKRLQVENEDLDPALNVGAEYYAEGQYVSLDDAQAGNGYNNASYRKLVVDEFAPGEFDLVWDGETVRTEPAIFAWATVDPTVTLETVDDPDGGRFHVASRVADVGGGFWSYEYAIHNLNSHLSMWQFSVPVEDGIAVRNVGFHDVPYHSGEPHDGTDWADSRDAGAITWSTASNAEDPNANALRWGTVYNFRFEAERAPNDEVGVMGLFRPSAEGEIVVDIPAPGCEALATADAGASVVACVGSSLLLDASLSDVAGCTNPTYRWLGSDGSELREFDAEPTFEVVLADCADGFFELEIACEGSSCLATDRVSLDCITLTPNAGGARVTCDDLALDGSGTVVTNCAVAEYRWLDPSGAVAADWSTDSGLALVGLTPADAGEYQLEVRCAEAPECTAMDRALVEVGAPVLPEPVYTVAGCGETFVDLRCGVDDPGTTYWWDLDPDVDADGDGDPANDADEAGCETTVSLPGGLRTVVVWSMEGVAGCVASASLEVDVTAVAAPIAVTGLRLSRSADLLQLVWDPQPGLSFVVVRGDLPEDGSGLFREHEADDGRGHGACDTGGAAAHVDLDDLATSESYYYLVGATDACNRESGLGTDSEGALRARRGPGDCP